LAPNRTYYWHIKAYNTLGAYSAWSETASFRTALTPPNLEIPIKGETILYNKPTFMWSHYDLPPADGYTIQVADNIGFTSPIINGTSKIPFYDSPKDLPANKTLYWRVQATGPNGPSQSEVWTFKTGNPPAAPTLSKPSNGSKTTTLSPTFEWNLPPLRPGVTVAYYTLEVWRDGSFVFSQDNIPERRYTATTPLAGNTKYTWRVAAFTAEGYRSVWSSVWSFTTPIAGPSLTAPLNGETLSALTFVWTSVSNAKNYTLQVSTVSSFSSTVINKTITGSTSYSPIESLPYDTVLYWHVKANFAIGSSAWSEVFTFRIY
jgi:hypothetical protein